MRCSMDAQNVELKLKMSSSINHAYLKLYLKADMVGDV